MCSTYSKYYGYTHNNPDKKDYFIEKAHNLEVQNVKKNTKKKHSFQLVV